MDDFVGTPTEEGLCPTFIPVTSFSTLVCTRYGASVEGTGGVGRVARTGNMAALCASDILLSTCEGKMVLLKGVGADAGTDNRIDPSVGTGTGPGIEIGVDTGTGTGIDIGTGTGTGTGMGTGIGKDTGTGTWTGTGAGTGTGIGTCNDETPLFLVLLRPIPR